MTDSPENNSVVLVVDDSPETLGMLNQALENSGMTTLVALEGKQAINIAKKMQPDIILLDAIMPNMDGFETCKVIKSNHELKNIPVIFMTGLSDTDSVVKGFEVGGVDYLTKPINPIELIARMNVHLQNARNTASAQLALDSAGQNIFAVNSSGEKIWATPQVEEILNVLIKNNYLEDFHNELRNWISHNPKEGNKCRFSKDQTELVAIYQGLSVNQEHLVRLMNEKMLNENVILKDSFSITTRESEVFLWLAKGKTNREIAMILEMSPRTVNKHLEQLFKKLGVDNRTTAAGMAIECLQKIRA